MAIDRLNSTSALISAIRAEIARKSERTRESGSAQRTQAQQRQHDASVLRKELAELVEGVSVQDEDQLRRIRPRMVKAVLLWEFGPRLREHSQWQPMLETIVTAFEKDDPEHKKLVELVRDLQRSKTA